MAPRQKSLRERAARALCEVMGGYPDTVRGGKKVWTYYLHEADLILAAALGEEGWRALVRDDDPAPSRW